MLDERLEDREFVAGEYSIADMACYPWIVLHERQGQDLNDFPRLHCWFETIRARVAVTSELDAVIAIRVIGDNEMASAAGAAG